MRDFTGRIAPEHLAKNYSTEPESDEEEDLIPDLDEDFEYIPPPAPASSPVPFQFLPPVGSAPQFNFAPVQEGANTSAPFMPVSSRTLIFNFGGRSQGGLGISNPPASAPFSAQPHYNFGQVPEGAAGTSAQTQETPAAGPNNNGTREPGTEWSFQYNPMIHSSSEFPPGEVLAPGPGFRGGQTAGALSGRIGLASSVGFTRHSTARIFWHQGAVNQPGIRVQHYLGFPRLASMRPTNGIEFRPRAHTSWNGPGFRPLAHTSWNGPGFRPLAHTSWNGPGFRPLAPDPWNGPETRPLAPNLWNGPGFRPLALNPWSGPETRPLAPTPWNGVDFRPLRPPRWTDYAVPVTPTPLNGPIATAPWNESEGHLFTPTHLNGPEAHQIGLDSNPYMNAAAFQYPVPLPVLNPPFMVPPYYQAPYMGPQYVHNQNNQNETIQQQPQQEQTNLNNQGLNPAEYYDYDENDSF